ncbi:MAG: hypothetical protein F6J87_02100 [Spirulina sp. SIO3F2]|nr:hypothetical protein [Spirulina sp. SIO3F2]
MQSSQPSTSNSLSQRAIIAACAAFAGFVAGYSVIQVGLSTATLDLNAQTQISAVPHEGTLWSDITQ